MSKLLKYTLGAALLLGLAGANAFAQGVPDGAPQGRMPPTHGMMQGHGMSRMPGMMGGQGMMGMMGMMDQMNRMAATCNDMMRNAMQAPRPPAGPRRG